MPQRIWIGLASLVALWIVVYWLTPGPSDPIVSTHEDLRLAAGRHDAAEAADAATLTFQPIVSVVPRPATTLLAGAPPDNQSANQTANQTTAPTPAQQPAPSADTPPTPASPAIIPPSFQIYTVRPGDTLSSIAQQFFGTTRYAGQIARANPTIDPIRLRPNTELKIPTDPRNIQGIPADPALQPDEPEPAFIEYVVARGDTLSQIAASIYGRSALWTHIRDANPQINRNATNLRPGMTIRIPPPPSPREP